MTDYLALIKEDLLDYLKISPEFYEKWSAQGITGEEWTRFGLSNQNPRDCHFFFLASSVYFLSISWIQLWRLWERGDKRLQKCKAILDDGHYETALDYGAGIGGEAFQLASMGYKISYYDLNALARDFVRFRSHKHSVPIRVLDPHDLFDLGLKFDVVFCFGVFEHVPDWNREILKVRSLLAEDGLLVHYTRFGVDPERYPYHFKDSVSDLNKALRDLKVKYLPF